jgi:hypothetical protein
MGIKSRLLIILLVFTGFSHTIPVQAGLKPQTMEFLDHYQRPLQWDNVEGSPVWISGIAPKYSFKHHYHVVTLQPGDTVIIRIKPHAMIRLFNPVKILDEKTLAAFSSYGNGLFRKLSFSSRENGTSLVVQPDLRDNGLFRLTHSSSAHDSVQIALFVSRYESPRKLLAYRNLLKLSAPAVNVKTKPYGTDRSFQRVSADHPAQIRLKGPLRLLLEHRLIFSPEELIQQTPYTFTVLLDTRNFFTISSSTGPDSRTLAQVDDLYPTLGNLRKSYVTLPKGEHILTLIPESDLLLRLTARDGPDYLLPDLNNPFPLDDDPARKKNNPLALFSISKQPSAKFQQEMTEPFAAAHHLWQNNRYPDGGLSAAMAMRHLTEQYPDSIELRNESKLIEQAYTFYRDLFPETQAQDLNQRYSGFISPRLKNDNSPQQRVLQVNNLPTVIDTIERAYFVDLAPAIRTDEQSSEETPSLTFLLPKRQTPSELRILVDVTKKHSGSLVVTIGNNPAILCDLLPQQIRPASEFELSKTEAAISLPSKIYPHLYPLNPGLDSKGRASAPRYVAELIVPLDSTEDKIVIQPQEKNETSLRIALQYRDSRPYTLTEPEYLLAAKNLARQKTTAYHIALKMLATPQMEFEQEEENYGKGIQEIEAFLRPLIRYIHTRDLLFSSSVYSTPDSPNTAPLPQEDIDSIRKRILLARNSDQWVSVLENAVLLYHGTHGQNRIDASMLIIDALEQSGEHYLAEMRLRGMLLYPQGSDSGHIAELAQLRLEKRYRKNNDIHNLSSLYAACFKRTPSPGLLEKLSGILLEEGRYRLALSATVILPAHEQKSDFLLRSMLKAGWHQTFQSEVAKIRTPEEQKFWLGLLQEKAGGHGEDYAQIREQARAIEEKLKHGNLRERQQAIFSWEKWQAQLPGPFSWKSEPWSISNHSGGVFLFSEAQDLKLLMFKASEDHPVQARIWGPVTMKFILRPLHKKLLNESLTGWGFLHIDDELELIPISNNRTVQQWVMPPAEDSVPGRAVMFERHLGPGPHDISLSSDSFSLLVGLQVHRPEFNNGLPPISHDAVSTLLKDVEHKEPLPQVSRWRGLIEDSLAVLPSNPQEEPFFFSSSQLQFDRNLESEKATSQTADPIARLEATRPDPPATETDKDYNSKKVTRLMAAGKWDKALAASRKSNTKERFRHMTLLTYLAEIKPSKHVQYETRAYELLKDYPLAIELHSLLRRISSHSQWQQVEQIQESAGLRILPQQNWQPESPPLRIRKALLTTLLDGDAVLTGKDPLVLSLNNYGVIELEVSWKLSELSYLHPGDLDIVYQLDDNQEKTLTFGADQPEHTVRMTIPSGRHRLVTTIKNRYTNQFLQVRFQELSPASINDDQGHIWSQQLKERTYHVINKDEPLRASIHGPAWIRIDEHRQNDTYSRYRYIDSGWQTIEVLPDTNQQEMLVRLFQRVEKNDNQNEDLSRTIIKPYPTLQPPLLTLDTEKKSAPKACFTDEHRQDATWSTALSWHKRRDLEEDTDNGESETFFQLTGSYYHFYESLPAYLSSSLFMRKRRLGGPALGLKGDISKRFNQFPLTLRLEGEAMTQNPNAEETEFFDLDPTEWSVRVKASAYQYRPITPKLQHRPALSIFGRLLSLTDSSSYAAGTIDQDIFTKYKSDHLNGMQFSEYLSYRPWLDTALFTRGSYTTNSDMNPFNPDNMRLSAGIAQLIGPAALNCRYQITHFFNDADRTRNIDRKDISLGLNWDHWLQDQSRLQLGLRGQYRADSGEFTGMAGLTWFFSTGRAMRDLRPEDDLFYTIKTNRASQLINNRMINAEVSP